MNSWRLMGKPSKRYVEPQEDFNRESIIVGETCYFVFSGGLFERIIKDHKDYQLHVKWPFRRMPLAISSDKKRSIHFPLYGSPRAANAVEQLAYCGVKNIIGLGLCGAISSKLQIGDIVAPNACVRGDAVTLHYSPIEYPAAADTNLLNKCISLLSNPDEVYHGIQLSTDALYRETHEQIDFWAEQGVISIDMECSTLFVVGQALGLRTCWFGVVSDIICNQNHTGSVGGFDVLNKGSQLFNQLIKGGKE